MVQIEKEIIEKAAGGDMNAFEKIYKALSSTVYTVAFNITGDHQDAEEATQDVFVKIFRKLPGFRFESSFGTWVYRIAMNSAINIYKAGTRRRQDTVSFEDTGDVAQPGPDAAREVLERQSAGSKIAEFLARLSPEHRSCIVLREIDGLDYKEIAEALRIPLNTVRSRLKRAREALVAMRGGVHYEL